jgi:hypothetical protein
MHVELMYSAICIPEGFPNGRPLRGAFWSYNKKDGMKPDDGATERSVIVSFFDKRELTVIIGESIKGCNNAMTPAMCVFLLILPAVC